MSLAILSLIVALFDLAFVFFLARQIYRVKSGSEKVREIADAIRSGAKAFLAREFKTMVLIFLLLMVLLGFLAKNILAALIFAFGALSSLLAGYIGMMISTSANSRTANSVQESFPVGFTVAIQGGQVMGFLVVGLGLLGTSAVWLFSHNAELLINYAFGASLVALFMRVGGGIFTKSADVGADLVGKVEVGIPEDDPRNPAVIADNVGDNVGDIAGMGSDLFESYVATIAATMIIGFSLTGLSGLLLPLILASLGVLASLLGTYFMRVPAKFNQAPFLEQSTAVRRAMDRGIITANVLMALSALIVFYFSREIKLFFAFLIGLLVGFIIGKTAEYYTDEKRKPTREIAKVAEIGPSNVIMEGLIGGMKSTVLPAIAVAIAIVLAYYLGGLYGIALASMGILGVLGINLATDCYGPIADNAAGIAEMSGMAKEVRQRAEALDAVGNSTAAVGKGFAIGAAALAALAWLVTFSQQAQIKTVDLLDSRVLAGIFIGTMLPLLFSALAMSGVSRGAWEVVNEVRRQFREKKGLLAGTEKPDYARVVDLTTKKALKGIFLPAFLVIVSPILVGMILGKEAVAGLMVGALSCGFLLALLMANAGAGWDNAKKYIEAGNLGGKGSAAHKAAVIGDTLGDPFKDTAGPSLNILIKLISIVSLIALPLFL